MSSLELDKVSTNEEENKTPDKKQIEAEEKEVMLKTDCENIEAAADKKVAESADGPVKAALAGDVTEQGREVKPKFIPIGAIKMPGFFTRNSDKAKDEEKEKDGDGEKSEEPKPKRHRLQFLHTCPFTQFMHHPQREEEVKQGEQPENTTTTTEGKKTISIGKYNVSVPNINIPKVTIPNISMPKLLQRRSNKDPEAALASMETLEDKVDATNDGMENVKLDTPVKEDPGEGKVQTKLPLKERIRQKKFIIDDMVVGAVVLLVLVVVIIGIIIGACAGPPAERPLRLGRYMTTLTACGPVEGVLDEGVYKYYGIPYAAPPVGDRRFAYAQPLNDISMCWNGTLELHNRTDLCLQFLENGTIVGSEDCLTLDIVTPHVRYDSPLPVVVLIGANSLSGGIGPAQPSPLYARTKEVVFVRPNFRLGPFGFLALDILSNTKYPPTSGNYAISDLLAALQWIKYNIKHFGGDPNAVTLLGHRAGATLTAALTTTKKAQKLYARAWLSSPSVVFPTEPLMDSERKNEQFKQISRCGDADCLRRLSSTDILSITPDTWWTTTFGTVPRHDEYRRSWMVLDGDFLRTPANESWIEHKKAKQLGKEDAFKPIVLGTTQHSAHSEVLKMKYLNWTSDLVEQTFEDSAIWGSFGTSVFDHFNKTYEGLVEMISSVRTLCPLVNLTKQVLGARLYMVMGSGAGGGRPGSGIAPVNADIEAILGTFDSEMVEQRRFMNAMQHLFYYYVWHGQLPGPTTNLIAVGQDLLPLQDLPVCRVLIEKGLVPRYAHID